MSSPTYKLYLNKD